MGAGHGGVGRGYVPANNEEDGGLPPPYASVPLVRAALAVLLRKLDLSASRAKDDLSLPSADEAMLDWLATSVRLGWTPI
jgi:hypothetical protein